MRLLCLSDLHLERKCDWSFPGELPLFDVAVFAGDVHASPIDAIRYLLGLKALQDRPIVYVAGNHELYDGFLPLNEIAGHGEASGTRLHYLAGSRNSVIIDGQAFIGTTLWTDYRLSGDREKAMAEAELGMTDHECIFDWVDGEPVHFMPDDALRRHRSELAHMKKALLAHGPGAVVVTHHGPSPLSVHHRYAGDHTSAAYCSDLSGLIRKTKPALWVHGHVHDSFDYRIGATRIVANPKGYGPHDGEWRCENPGFDERLVIEI